MHREPRGDGASLHVLEAVMVSVLMISAVAFVATFDTPAGGTDAARDLLQLRVDDALRILYDTPVVDSDLGDETLSVAIMECLQGACSRLDTRLHELLPPGAGFSVVLSNGYGRFVVHETGSPAAVAVSSNHLIDPAWSFMHLAPGLDAVNPLEDPLVLYSVPMFHSSTLHTDGSPLRVHVEARRVGDNALYVLSGAGFTRAADASEAASTPAVSLYFANATGAPVATLDARATTLKAGGEPSGASLPLTMMLNETGGARIPAGTRVSVHVPQGWVANASAAWNAPHWQILENATDASGGARGATITAALARDVVGEAVPLRINATYAGDDNDHYRFDATLARGAYAAASLIVTGGDHGLAPYEIPEVALSVPRPMGAGATTTWTLGVTAPATTLGTADTLVVTRIEIVEEHGVPIFGSIAPAGSARGGSWSVDAHKLVWTGSVAVSHHAPLDLAFRVVGSGTAGERGESAAFVPTADLEGWDARLTSEIAPGLYRGVFLPQGGDYRGYNATTGGQLWREHEVNSTTIYRATELPGTASYTVGSVVGLKDSLHGADVHLASRRVPTGGEAEIHVDVQSVLYQLGPVAATPTVRLLVYPPWGGDAPAPVYEATLLNGTSAPNLMSIIDPDGNGALDPSNAGRFQHNVSVPQTWLFGAYLVEVQVQWAEEVSAAVEGTPLSASLTRTARVYESFSVTPPDGLVHANPVYDVQLLAWFGDWG